MHPSEPISASDQLSALVRKHEHGFVLLDPMDTLELAGLIESRPTHARKQLKHAHFAQRPEQAPLLVRFDGPHDPLLDASLELARMQARQSDGPRQVAGWLFGTSSLDVLADRLIRRFDVNHLGTRRLLRFHDPRVQTCLGHILDSSQRAWLGAGTRHWVSLRDDEVLQEPFAVDDAPESTPDRLRVDAVGWLRLQCIEAINRSIAILRRQGLVYDESWVATIERLLVRAEQAGHRELVDRIAYAVHGVIVHPEFDRHPRVRDALAAAHRDGHGFGQAMAALTAVDLQTIATELDPALARKGLPA